MLFYFVDADNVLHFQIPPEINTVIIHDDVTKINT